MMSTRLVAAMTTTLDASEDMPKPIGFNHGGNHHGHPPNPTVHLHQQLVQRVISLGVGAPAAATPLPADSVDLVNEEDAGSPLPGHVEHVLNTVSEWVGEGVGEGG